MALFLSQALHYVTSRKNYAAGLHDKDDEGRALPFISSPVDAKAYAWLHRQKLTDPLVPGRVRRSRTVQQFEADQGPDSALAGTIFRKQHEASSLELFFDLFFVANLAVFTDIHAHVDAQSVANYIGFFSILWTTWFHISIYDVRFYTDCILSRFIKILCFGVMTSLVGLAAVYETISGGGMTRAFTGLSLVLMGLRFLLVIQYSLVLYFVHGFHKTLVPLVLTICVYAAAGVGFLLTYLLDRSVELDGSQAATHVIRWYIIIAVEIIAVLVISSIWRILSFRHTHLTERVGLLTLIVMGEGILGLIKSVAYDVLGRDISIWSEIGIVASAVVLIYFIYVFYFNGISHETEDNDWGSIRQQIWAVLHYFLHVAILLTVEGQTALIIWNSCRTSCMWFMDNFPSVSNPTAGYDSAAAFVSGVNASINDAATRFHYYDLADYYNQTGDLQKLENIKALYGSSEWNKTANEILDNIRDYVQYFIFVNFQAEGPKEIEETSDIALKVDLYNESFQVVFEYFYIGAGGFLILLAIMYLFGKIHLRKDEWVSVAIRLGAGIGLPLVSIVGFKEKSADTTSFRYQQPSWLIQIVTLSFLGVLVFDNISKVAFNETRRHRRISAASTLADVEAGNRSHHNANEKIEMQRRNRQQVQFDDAIEQGRTMSDDSEATLGSLENHASNGRTRGYATLVQDDDEHEDQGAQGGHARK